MRDLVLLTKFTQPALGAGPAPIHTAHSDIGIDARVHEPNIVASAHSDLKIHEI